MTKDTAEIIAACVMSIMVIGVPLFAIFFFIRKSWLFKKSNSNEYYHLRSHYACAWCDKDLLLHDVDDTGNPPNVFCDNCGEYTNIETGERSTLKKSQQ